MSNTEENVFDKTCGSSSRNKCLLGEAPFLHVLSRKLFGGKIFCVKHDYVCFAHQMDNCDGDMVKMIHWQGRRKPWKDWWDSENKKSKVDGVKGRSVRLWWQLYNELGAALAGTKKDNKPMRPRGKGKEVYFM